MKYLHGKAITSLLALLSYSAIVVYASPYVRDSEPRYDPYKAMEPANRQVDFLEHSKRLLKSIEESSGTTYSLPQRGDTRDFDEKISPADRLRDTNQRLMGTFENTEKMVSYGNFTTFNSIHNSGNKSYSLSYLQDKYMIEDGLGTFRRTFDQGTGNTRYGTIFFSTDNYYKKTGSINMAWGINVGIGLNVGDGRFASGSQSQMEFKLFTVPIDLSLSTELLAGNFARLYVSTGPSIMGLYQSRTDMDDTEPKKHRRQISGGYFGLVKLKISLSRTFLDSGFRLFSHDKISNMFLNLEARKNVYENFQDDLVIDGLSYGIGFSFESI